MLRSFIIGIALVVVAASSAQAQSLTRDDATLRRQVSTAFAGTVQSSVTPAVQSGRTLRLTPSAKSTLTTRADVRARTASPAQSSGKKPFFKTPWPYVIIAAVVVVAVAVAASGGSGGGY